MGSAPLLSAHAMSFYVISAPSLFKLLFHLIWALNESKLTKSLQVSPKNQVPSSVLALRATMMGPKCTLEEASP